MATKEVRIEALRRVPLLAGLSRRDLARIAELSKEIEFGAGAVVVKAGDLASDFYLILRGEALLTVPGGRTARLGPGDYFGEIAVLDGGPRSATIVAETEVSTLRVGRPEFISLLDTYGPITRKVLVEMAKRVRRAEG